VWSLTQRTMHLNGYSLCSSHVQKKQQETCTLPRPRAHKHNDGSDHYVGAYKFIPKIYIDPINVIHKMFF